MIQILLIGLGGFIGAISRYLMTLLVHKILPYGDFPYGTFAVNVFGCLLIGAVSGIVTSRQLINHELLLFVQVGILGGFTTFSSFGLETCNLLKEGEPLKAGLNITINIIIGLIAVFFGHFISRFFVAK